MKCMMTVFRRFHLQHWCSPPRHHLQFCNLLIPNTITSIHFQHHHHLLLQHHTQLHFPRIPQIQNPTSKRLRAHFVPVEAEVEVEDEDLDVAEVAATVIVATAECYRRPPIRSKMQVALKMMKRKMRMTMKLVCQIEFGPSRLSLIHLSMLLYHHRRHIQLRVSIRPFHCLSLTCLLSRLTHSCHNRHPCHLLQLLPSHQRFLHSHLQVLSILLRPLHRWQRQRLLLSLQQTRL